MAKQDFLAGGFYGKVGVFVGQRWKNIRTMRTYVIPEDPKTEKQLAWRASFAQCIQATHISAAMDWNSVMFQSDVMTVQNARQSTALSLIKDGVTGLQLVPLTQYGVSAPNVITAFYVITQPDGSYIAILEGDVPDEDMPLAIAIGDGSDEVTIDNTLVTTVNWLASLQYLDIESAGLTITSENPIRLCSISDYTDEDSYIASDVLTPVEITATLNKYQWYPGINTVDGVSYLNIGSSWMEFTAYIYATVTTTYKFNEHVFNGEDADEVDPNYTTDYPFYVIASPADDEGDYDPDATTIGPYTWYIEAIETYAISNSSRNVILYPGGLTGDITAGSYYITAYIPVSVFEAMQTESGIALTNTLPTTTYNDETCYLLDKYYSVVN